MYYGRIIYDTLEVAPKTFVKDDGGIIFNFNSNLELMTQYGFKPVMETIPPYDSKLEEIYLKSMTQDDDYVYLIYDVKALPNVGTITVDMSNYYTKAETYNRYEIQQMLNNLDIDFANIEELVTARADIDELTARMANIENANIGNLDVMYADIKELKAKYAELDMADIGDLTAINAEIDNLRADVATINTLINGHLTSDNIQSIVITGDKFTVENGFIKDAMIETLNASKINSGVLNTNNVVIQSEDGNMLLQGALQQFKDDNGNVRIQIGKDTTGDFTFVLYGEDGNGILLDETGIKASAISDGLIVDAMVSDNANISGGKIDISSLVTEINESGSTIKSSAIKFDDTNQTLDVAFNEMQTKIDNIEIGEGGGGSVDLTEIREQIQTNTTNISIAQGEIETLISNTTITKEDGTVIQLKDAYNVMQDTVDSHTQTIGSLETNYTNTLKTSSVQYYLSTSTTELLGGSWQDTAPEWVSGKYMWQRMRYEYTNGTISYSSPTCVAGAKGDTGADGTSVKILDSYDTLEELNAAHPDGNENGDGYIIGEDLYVWDGTQFKNVGKIAGEKGQSLVSFTAQWYLSTSNTTQENGEWVETMPAIQVGYYLWLRYRLEWENPTATTYTNPVLEQVAETVKEVSSKQSKLEQDLDGFKTTVNSTYAKIDTLNNYSTTEEMNSIINQKANEISTSVEEVYATKGSVTDVATNLSTNYSTTEQMNSAITQKANEITTNVSSTYATKTEVQGNLASVTTQYYVSTSSTSQTGGSWIETTPTWSSGTYIWQRMKYTYNSGSVSYSTPTCIQGAKGETGATGADGQDGKDGANGQDGADGKDGADGEKGQSLVKSTPQWALGTSIVNAPTTGWSEVMPEITEGYYLWLRYKLDWENPTSTTYTTPTIEQIGEAVKEVKTKQATLEQSLDGFKTTVSETYSTISDMNDLREELEEYEIVFSKETILAKTDLDGNLIN